MFITIHFGLYTDVFFYFSDHVALLKAFAGWKEAKRSGWDRDFCWDNFLSPVTLQMIEDMRNQFVNLLSDIGFIDKAKGPKVLLFSVDYSP